VTLFWSAPLRAAEQSSKNAETATTSTASEGSGSRVRTKIGIGGGYPEMIALSLAIGVPNVLEGELSVGAFFSSATVELRVGYPWVIVGEKRPGWWVSLIPKAGARYVWAKYVDLLGNWFGCEGGSYRSEGDEVSAVGVNGVLSFEWGYIIGKRFGLLLQLTAGATWLFAGRNEHVIVGCSGDEEKTTATENSPWSPDLRATLVFTF
jgi:hypothetical protein